MPWLLYRVVRDRPGLLHDLTAVVNDNGLDTTSGIGNTRAIMLGISGDPTPIIQRLTTEGVELINVINESVIPHSILKETIHKRPQVNPAAGGYSEPK